jgi:hypothetical protein
MPLGTQPWADPRSSIAYLSGQAEGYLGYGAMHGSSKERLPISQNRAHFSRQDRDAVPPMFRRASALCIFVALAEVVRDLGAPH